ncbi:putative MFS family arabinose efflux permease [Sediminihabitans luteus]|uniref:Putative MFS family arabinose efflux permease n=1 Tax=Sediminihabitans luteus TaxID=1138585 RepID=A0A2M9D0L5_9CELL|nr:MFS transporter [Sediminihabitans luteus]PJJ77732.1 putative MFS family arabinose efflux permease [Sediminihabitans luteus]GIJ00041.1 MFS transporter [Sediminihabitans luteus]
MTSHARDTDTGTAPGTAPDTGAHADAAPQTPGAPPPTTAPRGTLLGLVALVVLAAFETLGVATAMPAVADDLDGLSLYGLAFAGTIAASVVGLVLAGPWCDRVGPRAPMLAGLGGFAAGLVVAGLAPTMTTFLAGRTLQGLGGGVFWVAVYVLVGRTWAPAERPRVFALFSAAWIVPSLVGPALAGLVVEHVGWRWIYLGVAVAMVPLVALVLPALRTSDAAPAAPADAASTRAAVGRVGWSVAAAGGVALLHLAGSWTGTTRVAGLLVGALLVAVATPRLLPRGTFRAARGLPAVVTVQALVSAAFVGAEALIPLLLTTERGYSAPFAGLVLTAGALGWSAGSWARQRWTARWSAPTFLQAGGAVLALGVAGSALLVSSDVPVAAGVTAWVLAGVGMGVVSPTLSVLALDLAPAGGQGDASSALQVGGALAQATALALTGSLVWALRDVVPAGYLAAFVVVLVLGAAGAALGGRVAPGAAQRASAGRASTPAS